MRVTTVASKNSLNKLALDASPCLSPEPLLLPDLDALPSLDALPYAMLEERPHAVEECSRCSPWSGTRRTGRRRHEAFRLPYGTAPAAPGRTLRGPWDILAGGATPRRSRDIRIGES